MLDNNNKRHYIRINCYTAEIQSIFDKYNKAFAKLGLSVSYDKEKGLFYFKDFPEISDKADKLFKQFAKEINAIITNGVSKEWNESNSNNDKLVQQIFGNAWQNEQYRKYLNHNLTAKEYFLERKRNGLNLSQKVWKYTEIYKENIEDCLSVGIEKGTSATKLSREIRQFLNEPNKLFRRVRDEFGELHLSKNAKAYNPGAGIYRSSYKNALRLARTEINMAYRYADYERWKRMDFVLGIDIQLSEVHPKYDICDILAGQYPKTFKFCGWHPQCLCFATPILMTDEQFFNDEKVEEIKDLPQNFKDWYNFHKDEINKAKERGKLPYFIRDNEKVIRISNNREEYNKLKSDNNYYDVQFDERTGGLKATHKDHNFDKKKGGYEKEVQDIFVKNGYKIILSSENSTINGQKQFDGFVNDLSMEISTKEIGTYKNIKYGLQHCASKKPDIAILYLPNKVSNDNLQKGFGLWYGLKGKKGYYNFKSIYVINGIELIKER